MKTVFTLVGTFVILMTLAIVFTPSSEVVNHSQTAEVAPEVKARAAPKHGPSRYEQDANLAVYAPENLTAAFRDNEVAAERTFAGPTAVAGVVGTVQTSPFGGSHVEFLYQSSWGYVTAAQFERMTPFPIDLSSVKCKFADEEASVSRLHNGDRVVLVGVEAHKFMGDIYLTNCYVSRWLPREEPEKPQ